jgi:hypothetical protein
VVFTCENLKTGPPERGFKVDKCRQKSKILPLFQKHKHCLGTKWSEKQVFNTIFCCLLYQLFREQLSRRHVKGIVQQILRGVKTRLIQSVLLNWRPIPFFFLNFEGTPSQEEHKTIFSSLKINEMALSDKIDVPAFLHLCEMTYQINSGI